MNRRDAMEAIAAFGAAALGLVGCARSTTSPSTQSSMTSGSATGAATSNSAAAASCAVTPEETGGPYPDKLGLIKTPAFFRSDVTEGKSGLPLTLKLTVVSGTSCTPVAGAFVEIWQCDAAGDYSEYSQPGFDGTGQTFLRGLQTTDAAGLVTFRTVYPGWYSGRATHIHVEVFVNGTTVKTTQVAFPESVTSAVYKTGVYASHGQNPTGNSSDNVFSDGTDREMATLAGDTASGYTATLTIAVA
jgi:protocatechuate 3,4-dioxygenase beta subunit